MPLLETVTKRPLRRGDAGQAVREWQGVLRRKGFVVAQDGDFGLKTENATRVAQRWANADEDGIVGPETVRKVQAKQRTKRPVSVVKSVLGRPKVIDARRGQAGFPRHVSRLWDKRTAVRAVVGHYTGGPASFIADARFHVESSYLTAGGAPAIAYALGIDKDGTLFVFNDWQDVTWHCDGGQNTATLGIVFRGGSEGPSLAQRRTLSWLIRNLAAGTFKPSSKGVAWPRIELLTTHRHVRATSCPGELGEAFYRAQAKRWTTRL